MYNRFEKFTKLAVSLFLYSGAVLFSFAPYLSLRSSVTKIILYLLYFIFFCSFIFFCFSISFDRKKIGKIILLYSFIFFYSFLGIKQAGLAAFVSSMTNFIIPIIFCTVLYISNFNEKIVLKPIFNKFLIIFTFCVLINCIYSIFTVFTFDGNLKNLYVFKTIDGNEYNYFRNGRLRAFGFLHNAVTLSNYLSICVVLYINRIKLKKFFFSRIFILCIVLLTLFLTGSRTPILSAFFSIVLLRIFDRKRNIIPFMSLLFIAFILITLAVTGKGDLSALGRVTQYLEAGSLFILNPLGYGVGYAGYPKGVVSFDCAILVIIVNFGIMGLLYILSIYKKVINKKRTDNRNLLGDGLIINLFILSGFANVIHLGFLTLTFFIFFLDKKTQIRNNLGVREKK